MTNRVLLVIAGLFALLTLGASIVVPYLVLNAATSKTPNLAVPLLALSGFLGIFACVALLVLAFKAMDLTDSKQALGMPEGSVRALIAIFLIVTLGMAALFLLGSPKSAQAANPPGQSEKPAGKSPAPEGGKGSSGDPASALNQTTAGTSGAAPQATGGARPGVSNSTNSAPTNKAGTSSPPAPNTAENTRNRADSGPSGSQATANENAKQAGTSRDDSDLAKQFFTLVGGLVTTVIGFYFGSQTANSAATKGANAATAAATESIKAFQAGR